MFDRFTESARRVVFYARYEASELGGDAIAAEHLLLGILREDPALIQRYLPSPAARQALRAEIRRPAGRNGKSTTAADMPLSPEARQALGYAAEEAERRGDPHIGPEQLLRGLQREETGFTADLLRRYGAPANATPAADGGGAEAASAGQARDKNRIQAAAAASNQAEAAGGNDGAGGGGEGLRAVGISKRYAAGGQELQVLSGIHLELGMGEMVAVVGESGCGKSTLLHVLSTLDTPTEGAVYFAASCLSRMGSDQLAEFRNREIGFVWQMPHLLPEFTLLENVMLPRMIAGETAAAAARQAAARLEEVGLERRGTHRAGELSGGEQQRGALARALVMQPRLLMADEPTGNLDEATAERVFALLVEMHRRHGLTTLLVTHNLQFARRCDRVWRLHQGKLERLDTAFPGPSEAS